MRMISILSACYFTFCCCYWRTDIFPYQQHCLLSSIDSCAASYDEVERTRNASFYLTLHVIGLACVVVSLIFFINKFSDLKQAVVTIYYFSLPELLYAGPNLNGGAENAGPENAVPENVGPNVRGENAVPVNA